MANPTDDNPNAPETHDIRINAKQGPDPNSKQHGGNFLTAKMGPLPVYGWLVVAVAGYLLYRYYKNQSSSNPSGVMPDSGATPSGAPTTPDVSVPGLVPAPVPGSPANNSQWLADAESALKRLGYGNGLIKISLDRYLAGEQLDAKEEAVIETATNIVGHPPVAGTFGTPAPPHKQVKPKPKKPTVKVPHQVKGPTQTLANHHLGNGRVVITST